MHLQVFTIFGKYCISHIIFGHILPKTVKVFSKNIATTFSNNFGEVGIATTVMGEYAFPVFAAERSCSHIPCTSSIPLPVQHDGCVAMSDVIYDMANYLQRGAFQAPLRSRS